MANNFDLPPIYDPITRENSEHMSGVYMTWLATTIETLVGYLTLGGILLPQLTTAQRDALGATQPAQNGQIIYNTTVGAAQYFKAGVWTSI